MNDPKLVLLIPLGFLILGHRFDEDMYYVIAAFMLIVTGIRVGTFNMWDNR